MLRTHAKDYYAREVYRQNGKFQADNSGDLAPNSETEKEYIATTSENRRRIVTGIFAKGTNYWIAEVYLNEDLFCVLMGQPYERDNVYPTTLRVNKSDKLKIKFINKGTEGTVDIKATVEYFDEDLTGVCLEN